MGLIPSPPGHNASPFEPAATEYVKKMGPASACTLSASIEGASEIKRRGRILNFPAGKRK